jgi:two-component system, sensor histidine kinase
MISTVWLIVVVVSLLFLLLMVGGLGYVLQRKYKEISHLNEVIIQNKREITELQEKISRAIDKNKEIDELKSALLCNISHEIRTPLNAITGFCDLIASPTEGDTQKVQYANIISRNVDTLLELVNDIFDISQIESGNIAIEKKEVKVNELIATVQTYFNMEKTKIGKSHLQFIVNKANKNSNFSFLGDLYKIRRSLNNLVENAMKFTTEGTIEIGYNFDTERMVTFYVKDEGIGLDKAELITIFDRFRQADERSVKQFGGLGLGLTVANGFSELMGGRLWAESEPGKGATFYFSVPYLPS